MKKLHTPMLVTVAKWLNKQIYMQYKNQDSENTLIFRFNKKTY